MAPPNSYKELWYSGKLAEIAKECRRPGDLARRLEVTTDALSRAMRRLREDDPAVPSLTDWFSSVCGATDFDNEESTSPGLPPRMVLPEHDFDIDVDDGEPVYPDGQAPVVEQLNPIEEHRLKKKNKELEAFNRDLMNQIASAHDQLEILTGAQSYRIDPIIPGPPTSGKLRNGVPVFLVSDLHLEQEVKPEKVNFMNRFNLAIARRRMTRLFEGMRWFIQMQRHSFNIDTVCMWLGGDIINNYLHPDDVQSNLLAPPAAFAFARQLLSDGIRYILEDDSIKQLVIPCNDGNHGRISKDLQATMRTDLSLETLLYGMLANEFKDEKRIQFEIAGGDHLYTKIYNQTIRWTHGAEFRGGSGIGGIMVPIYRGLAKIATVKHADITVLGHFHQLTFLRDLVINGSLVGYSPYALRIGARYEEAAQGAFMIDEIRGKSVSAPIWVADVEEQELV